MRHLAFCLAALVFPTAPAALSNKDNVDRVELRTQDEQTLAASFFLPKDTSDLVPGVLLVHDAGESRRQVEELADRLQRKGFAVMSLDLRGHGESVQDGKPWDKLNDDERTRLWAFAPRDVEAATQWLAGRREVHSSNINIVGIRAASALAARQGSRDLNISSVVLVEPEQETFGFDMKQEVVDLEGLPTAILACKGHADVAEAIARVGNDRGDPYIEVIESRSKEKSKELEKRQLMAITDWLATKALPRKGR